MTEYTFTAVNNDEQVISGDSIVDQRGIRTPHIYRAPNGRLFAYFEGHGEGKLQDARAKAVR